MNLRSVSAATPSRDDVVPCAHPVPLAELERDLGGARDDVVPCAHPVPLAELERDLGGAPVEGWELYLGKEGVAIVPDDLGRNCVSRQHARMLLDQSREDDLRRRRLAAQQEQEAIEAYERFRASLPPGLPAGAIPDGASYADLVRQAAKDARPKRESVLEHALSHPAGGVVYHELPRGDE